MTALNQSGWKPGTPTAAISDGATTTGNRALMLEEPLIFEIGDNDTTGVDFERSSAPAKAGALASTKSTSPPVSKKLSFKDQRDLDRLPAEIDRLISEIADAEAALHDPDLYAKNPARFDDLTRKAATLRAEMHTAEMRWLEVAEMAEQLATAQ